MGLTLMPLLMKRPTNNMARNIAPIGLAHALLKYHDAGRSVRVGLVGCGEMGIDLITGVTQMQGIEVAAVTTRTVSRVFDATRIAYGEASRAREVSTASSMNTTIEQGLIAATDDLDLMLANDLIDVVVDATGYPEAGAEIGYKTLQNNKHLVMMNVEADVTIGRYLKYEADRHGLIYTLGAGDEPSAAMELIEFVSSLGAEIVSTGKGKNNPLKFDAVPDDYHDEAKARGMNVRMLVEFIDGSKTMVEMAAIANATGLVPDCAGMHGPKADLADLKKVLIPQCDGGILSKSGVVDYSIGRGIAPGVFVIIKTDHPRIQERFEDLKMGQGPYFTFHRPYHLTAMEVPLTCARVVLDGRADMMPLARPVAEVCAVAKRDLKAGEALDFIGLYTYRAWTMTVEEAQANQAIPCGLLEGATVTKPIKAGELITKDNAAIRQDQWIARLRTKQDQLPYGSG